MSLSRTVRVVNSAGLHARPCHAIVSTALGYECSLRIRRSAPSVSSNDVNGKSILELMTLEARQGSELELCAAGTGESELLADLAALFEGGFGEFEPAG